jgi:hypothetical protein
VLSGDPLQGAILVVVVSRRIWALRIRHSGDAKPIAQIINVQNASSGMWAFGEKLEVMYMVIFLYLIWPSVFNIVGRVAAIMAPPKVR